MFQRNITKNPLEQLYFSVVLIILLWLEPVTIDATKMPSQRRDEKIDNKLNGITILGRHNYELLAAIKQYKR